MNAHIAEPKATQQPLEATITLEIKGNSLSVNTSQGITLPDAMQALCSAACSMLRQTHQHISANLPEGVTSEKVKEDLYDMANLMFSNVLSQFAPEIEMRPDLTCEAILKAENEILDEYDS